jgi:hypothetical protein
VRFHVDPTRGFWQNVRALDGFRKWMRIASRAAATRRRSTQMLSRFCKQKGVEVPPYIQHTGGDAEFLELALKTDRIPA